MTDTDQPEPIKATRTWRSDTPLTDDELNSIRHRTGDDVLVPDETLAGLIDRIDAAESALAEMAEKYLKAFARLEGSRIRADAAEQALAEMTRERDALLPPKKEWVDRAYAAEAENARLREALQQAREDMEGWGAYASEYFQKKWGLADDLAAIDTALRTLEGSDGQ